MADLLNCPFCDKTPFVEPDPSAFGGYSIWRISCIGCGVRFTGDREKIEAKWNRRPNTKEVTPSTSTNIERFQLLCKRFLKWCDKSGSFKVDDELLTLIIDMRSATKNIQRTPCSRRKECKIEAHEGCYGCLPSCYVKYLF